MPFVPTPVTDVPAMVFPARGNRKWMIIHNADATNRVYLSFLNQDASLLTAANGIPLNPGEKLVVTQDINRAFLTHQVNAVADTGNTIDLRYQEG